MDIGKSTRRASFLKSFESLQKDFDASLQAAKRDEKSFKDRCITFQSNIDTHLRKASNHIAEDNPLSQQMSVFSETIKRTNASWKIRIAKQDTGVRFREGFDDSLMVFVYGKVKSGKSSLGNYVAWGHTDPTKDLKQQTLKEIQPIYFSGEKTNVKDGDADKEAESNKEFRVGATEATSTIQGFSLPGLTWIDSPGLHSKNEDNDRLARDYVKHSDLILYTMKSDSPGRASDLKEIADLYNADKRFLLLLTGSDQIEPDWDEDTETQINTLVMKDEASRQSQRDFIRKELSNMDGLKDNLDNIDIISFSARYAQENQNSLDAFQDSGMGQLFDVLEETSKSSGVKLKQQTPLIGFRSFLADFKEDLTVYLDFVSEFSNKFSGLESEVVIKLTRETMTIKQSLNELIRKSFTSIPDEDRNDELKILKYLDKLKINVNEMQITLLSEAMQRVLSEFAQGFGEDIITIVDSSAIYELPEFKIETKEIKKIVTITKGTRRRNSGIGSILGGAVGSLLGPVGSIVGAALGGIAGSALGKSASSERENFTVNIGDNLSQIEQKFINMTTESINKQMTKFNDEVFNSFLIELQSLTTALEIETIKMSEYFDTLTNSINLTLEDLNKEKACA